MQLTFLLGELGWEFNVICIEYTRNVLWLLLLVGSCWGLCIKDNGNILRLVLLVRLCWGAVSYVKSIIDDNRDVLWSLSLVRSHWS